jgi:hypothetical protein
MLSFQTLTPDGSCIFLTPESALKCRINLSGCDHDTGSVDNRRSIRADSPADITAVDSIGVASRA